MSDFGKASVLLALFAAFLLGTWSEFRRKERVFVNSPIAVECWIVCQHKGHRPHHLVVTTELGCAVSMCWDGKRAKEVKP